MEEAGINRLKNFPVTFFSMIMGLSGFTIALSKFYHLRWFPEWPFTVMLAVTTVLFLAVLAAYLLKLTLYPEEVAADYSHRIRISFMPTVSISLLLLSIAWFGKWPMVAAPLWLLGTVMHTVLTFHIISVWIRHDFEIYHFNPAWFIPVVGNILIPVTGVVFGPALFSAFSFGLGILFWLIMSTIIFYRLIFHKTMPQKFMPTLFILLAPPAVGFIAYMRLTHSYDFIAQALLLLAYFFFVLLIFLNKNYRTTPFFMSWWAYTFPLASFTIASVVAFQVTKSAPFNYIAWLGMGIMTIVVLVVAAATAGQVRNRAVCVKED